MLTGKKPELPNLPDKQRWRRCGTQMWLGSVVRKWVQQCMWCHTATQSPRLSFATKCLKISGTSVSTRKTWSRHTEHFHHGVVEFTCWQVSYGELVSQRVKCESGLQRSHHTKSEQLRGGRSSRRCPVFTALVECSLEATDSLCPKG